ncbi:unnamed protein product [Gongylonema pulchrum]|uniref:Uncharacterized protein n=1 Tax=Gongylonema pulchrum TaxID=637853 RepID=A0A183DA02_9BILA|nr:unnamed protein product [Gongylonema pulchrum]
MRDKVHLADPSAVLPHWYQIISAIIRNGVNRDAVWSTQTCIIPQQQQQQQNACNGYGSGNGAQSQSAPRSSAVSTRRDSTSSPVAPLSTVCWRASQNFQIWYELLSTSVATSSILSVNCKPSLASRLTLKA